MAPEQVRGKAVDRRADVWAFGVVLYEMLAGQRAFIGDSSTDTMLVVVSQDPDWTALPQATPASIRKLLRRCLEKDRKRRLDSAAAARLEIEDALTAPAAVDRVAPAATASAPRQWLAWIVANAVLTGETLTLADDVEVDGLLRTAVSVAATGLVAYRTGAGSAQQLTWVDRSGATRGTVGGPDFNNQSNPRVSPDGKRVVVSRTMQGNTDLWLLEGARSSRFTFDAGNDDRPVWSPDGARIVFYATRAGRGDLYQKLASGAAAEELLPISDQPEVPDSWSADGRFLLFHRRDPQTDADLWVLPMQGVRTPTVFRQTPSREAWGAFSPDDKWVAYYSNESGQIEIYVRPFVPPSPGPSADRPAAASASLASAQWQVSTAGGVFPLWRPDGKEPYYIGPGGAMMAVPITIAGATMEPGVPVVLFHTRIYGGGVDLQLGRQYDVAADGRFLINTELDDAASPITLLMNWRPEGRQ